MSNPYIGEIRMFGGNFAPAGWMFCDGQLLPISENDALFTLIGTTYGGDGQSTFALPDLRGRLPLHQGTGSSGSSYLLGQNGGVEAVTLTVNQIPAHGHPPLCNNNAGTLTVPTNAFWAGVGAGFQQYSQPTSAHTMHPGAIALAGGGQPHDNFSPYLCVNFIISLFGVFPSQT